jgi:hypothetical protein
MDDLPGWFYLLEEVSAGVYRVQCMDDVGHSIEASGTNQDALIEECTRSATELQASIDSSAKGSRAQRASPHAGGSPPP